MLFNSHWNLLDLSDIGSIFITFDTERDRSQPANDAVKAVAQKL